MQTRCPEGHPHHLKHTLDEVRWHVARGGLSASCPTCAKDYALSPYTQSRLLEFHETAYLKSRLEHATIKHHGHIFSITLVGLTISPWPFPPLTAAVDLRAGDGHTEHRFHMNLLLEHLRDPTALWSAVRRGLSHRIGRPDRDLR